MNNTVYIALFCTGLLSLVCCSDNSLIAKKTGSGEYQIDAGKSLNEMGENLHLKSSTNRKVIDGIEYKIHAISSIDYIQKKGVKIEKEDLPELRKETVFMLELKTDSAYESFFDSEDIVFDKDDAVKYLIGKIQDDFKIRQDGKLFMANGVNYEGQITTQDQIRVTFYVKGIDLNKPYTVEYYDQLFGKGLVKFKRTTNEIIS